MFRITLWSGGQPSLTYYVKETPRLSEGMVAFRSDDGTVVRLMGSVSIEEGEFAEQRINTMRRR
jgi:hypothetical protein